jgi:hypothetical protein
MQDLTDVLEDPAKLSNIFYIETDVSLQPQKQKGIPTGCVVFWNWK